MSACPLCEPKTETVLYQNEQLRVILVTDQALVPAYCRVIWQQHVAEMTDLSTTERQALMDMVYFVESQMLIIPIRFGHKPTIKTSHLCPLIGYSACKQR